LSSKDFDGPKAPVILPFQMAANEGSPGVLKKLLMAGTTAASFTLAYVAYRRIVQEQEQEDVISEDTVHNLMVDRHTSSIVT